MTPKKSVERQPHQRHRYRFKRQYLKNPEAFADHQKLELLLFYPIPRKDTNPLAHELIDLFGSLKDVLESTTDELVQVKGVGHHTAAFLHTIAEVSKRLMLMDEPPGISAANGFMLEALLYSSFAREGEQVFLACLDERLEIVTSQVFTADEAKNGSPEFVTSWLTKQNQKQFIVAKYRPEGTFNAYDRRAEQESACRLKSFASPNAVLMKYLLLTDETVTSIEI